MPALVYACDNFLSYLARTKVIICTNYVAIQYLFNKKDASPQLIRQILLFQEFDLDFKGRKGSEIKWLTMCPGSRAGYMFQKMEVSEKNSLINNCWY